MLTNQKQLNNMQLCGYRICLQCRRPGFNFWVWKIPWRRDKLPTPVFLHITVAQLVKNTPAKKKRIRLQCRRPGFNPKVGKIPWRGERLPTAVFWPREFRLYSPWGHKDSDMTEQLSLSNNMRLILLSKHVDTEKVANSCSVFMFSLTTPIDDTRESCSYGSWEGQISSDFH